MSNTHGVPDMMVELDGTIGDLLPACVVSTTWPVVPGSGLTLGAFSTKAYVRAGTLLTYVDQPAVTVTIVGGDGTYWLAVTDDTFSAFSGWTRRDGSHYMWRLSATRPSDVDNLLVFQQLTVSGGNITAVSTPSGVTRAEALRALSGLGTMATQNANAVAITGGSATGLSTVTTTGNVGIANTAPSYPLDVTGEARITGPCSVSGKFNVGGAAIANHTMFLQYTRTNDHALIIRPLDVDTGGGFALGFTNVAAAFVGSISTTATATSFNTSSDRRLKRNVTPLTDALATLRQLRPVSYFWQVNDAYGEGFLGDELQQAIPYAVTGEPDAVNDDGSVRPMGVDLSKVVPTLTAAAKELLAQVEALTARVASLEEQLGL